MQRGTLIQLAEVTDVFYRVLGDILWFLGDIDMQMCIHVYIHFTYSNYTYNAYIDNRSYRFNIVR